MSFFLRALRRKMRFADIFTCGIFFFALAFVKFVYLQQLNILLNVSLENKNPYHLYTFQTSILQLLVLTQQSCKRGFKRFNYYQQLLYINNCWASYIILARLQLPLLIWPIVQLYTCAYARYLYANDSNMYAVFHLISTANDLILTFLHTNAFKEFDFKMNNSVGII